MKALGIGKRAFKKLKGVFEGKSKPAKDDDDDEMMDDEMLEGADDDAPYFSEFPSPSQFLPLFNPTHPFWFADC